MCCKISRPFLRLAALCLLLTSSASLSWSQSTTTVTWNFATLTGGNSRIVRFTVASDADVIIGTNFVFQSPVVATIASCPSLTNGVFTTNVVCGVNLRATASDGYTVWRTNFFFPTNTAGQSVNAAIYAGWALDGTPPNFFFASQVSGGGGGVTYTNTTDLAGVVSSGGIGTNAPYDPMGTAAAAAQAATNGLGTAAFTAASAYDAAGAAAAVQSGLGNIAYGNSNNITVAAATNAQYLTGPVSTGLAGGVAGILSWTAVGTTKIGQLTFDGSLNPALDFLDSFYGGFVYGEINANPLVLNYGNGYPVGIGTNAPMHQLDVSGDMGLSGALYDSTASHGTAGQTLTSTSTGVAWSSAPAGGLTNSSPNVYLGIQAYTLEQFGAGPASTLYDVSETNGNTMVYSASANFTSALVGDLVCLYTDGNDTNWVYTTVASVPNAHNLVLASPALATATGVMMNYGVNCYSAFTNAVNSCYVNGVRRIQGSNCMYMFDGTLQPNGLNQISLFKFPEPTMDKYGWFGIEIVGTSEANISPSGYLGSQGSPRSGTIFFCATKQTQKTNCCVFGLSSTNGGFTSLDVTFRDITFLQPSFPQLNWIDKRYGGGLLVQYCTFWIDFAPGQINALFNTNSMVDGPYNATAILLGVVGNNAKEQVQNTTICGYGTGIRFEEHVSLTHDIIGANRTGLEAHSGAGDEVLDTKLINNITNYWNTGGQVSPISGDLYVENAARNGWKPIVGCDFYDSFTPNQTMYGNLVLSGNYPDFSDGTNHFLKPPRYLSVSCGVYLPNSASNIFGVTIDANHFTEGVQTPGATPTTNDWANSMYFGYNTSLAATIFYTSFYNQYYFKAYNPNGIWKLYDDTTTTTSTYDFANGIWTASSFDVPFGGAGFVGNGAGLTNLPYSALSQAAQIAITNAAAGNAISPLLSGSQLSITNGGTNIVSFNSGGFTNYSQSWFGGANAHGTKIDALGNITLSTVNLAVSAGNVSVTGGGNYTMQNGGGVTIYNGGGITMNQGGAIKLDTGNIIAGGTITATNGIGDLCTNSVGLTCGSTGATNVSAANVALMWTGTSATWHNCSGGITLQSTTTAVPLMWTLQPGGWVTGTGMTYTGTNY